LASDTLDFLIGHGLHQVIYEPLTLNGVLGTTCGQSLPVGEVILLGVQAIRLAQGLEFRIAQKRNLLLDHGM
jgi:hypothetical protein